MRRVALILLLFCGLSVLARAQVRVVDSDGVERVLNREGRVTVVLYTNAALQNEAREAGAALYPLHGREGFRLRVVVDLRGTLADWARGYTQRRMSRDLDKEAKLIQPYFGKNGGEERVRTTLSATADFDGSVCRKLGWKERSEKLQVVVFGRDSREAFRWSSETGLNDLVQKVEDLLRSSTP